MTVMPRCLLVFAWLCNTAFVKSILRGSAVRVACATNSYFLTNSGRSVSCQSAFYHYKLLQLYAILSNGAGECRANCSRVETDSTSVGKFYKRKK